jgi:Fe-S cluster biogenesis protein NfuA
MIDARAQPRDMRRMVESRLPAVRRQLSSHGGGVDLVGVSRDGVVELRFTGMCAACMLKPLTMASVIQPAFADLDGVSRVTAPGTRLSPQAMARLAGAVRYASPSMPNGSVR